MQRKHLIKIILLLLTLANILVFVFRENFQYKPHSTYASLYGRCEEECRQEWNRFADDYDQNELDEARKLTNPVVEGLVSDHQRILALGNFLYGRFHHRLGRPNEAVLTASPLSQYKKLSSSDSLELWCGNFAAMFSFFCRSQGITCRTVEIMQPGDRHVVNECYLNEMGKWVVVDLTNGFLVCRSTGGALLDLIALRDSLMAGRPVRVLKAGNDSKPEQTVEARAMPVPYTKEFPVYYYLRTNNDQVYAPLEKLKRYLIADAHWYKIFSRQDTDNGLFRLKQGLLGLWLLSFFVFLISQTKFRS